MTAKDTKNTIVSPGFYDQGGADRINNISMWLKREFGRKMIKLSIDGGFTCPNRDGTEGVGGCLFCGAGAGGDFASDIDSQIKMYQNKWPDAGYLAYFQNHTNTYGPVEVLREKYYQALEDPRISGIVIATRPDCLPDDVLSLLSEMNRDHFMWVELGLQTIHEDTAELINRCYPLKTYDDAMERLNSAGIRVVTHLILGLPGETEDDMKQSAAYACGKGTWGIKLHMLNVVRGSRLAEEMPGYIPFDDMNDYIRLVCDILEKVPPQVTIHRLTADAPRSTLIAPEWSFRKRTILNGIHAELRRRGTRQGSGL